jgi:hypothetical protein
MPKRWRIVPTDGAARLSAASGGEGGGGSGKFKVKVFPDRGRGVTLPWEWDSRQEAREAIEGTEEKKGWRQADIEEG